jgi:hypothetical protein
LSKGREFYDRQEQGLGDYFFNCLLTDIESLSFYAGIHSIHHGFNRMLSKRFPFSIYYEVKGDFVVIIAILDMRRNPAWRHDELTTRLTDPDTSNA